MTNLPPNPLLRLSGKVQLLDLEHLFSSGPMRWVIAAGLKALLSVLRGWGASGRGSSQEAGRCDVSPGWISSWTGAVGIAVAPSAKPVGSGSVADLFQHQFSPGSLWTVWCEPGSWIKSGLKLCTMSPFTRYVCIAWLLIRCPTLSYNCVAAWIGNPRHIGIALSSFCLWSEGRFDAKSSSLALSHFVHYFSVLLLQKCFCWFSSAEPLSVQNFECYWQMSRKMWCMLLCTWPILW